MKRRDFVLGAAGAAAFASVAGWPLGAWAVPPGVGEAPALKFQPGVAVPTLDELEEQDRRAAALRGTKPPYPDERQKAKRILARCPSRCNPMSVAQYFNDLRNKRYNSMFGDDAHKYAMEWPVRFNPIIVGFFDATDFRQPAGDTTAWCAAFMNWCITQARKGRPDQSRLLKLPRSAASRTFRSWGKKTTTPVPGDLAVFSDPRNNGLGHVAFYISQTSNEVLVLGGNQQAMKENNEGEVNIRYYPKDGPEHRLHSFRTDRSLHDMRA